MFRRSDRLIQVNQLLCGDLDLFFVSLRSVIGIVVVVFDVDDLRVYSLKVPMTQWKSRPNPCWGVVVFQVGVLGQQLPGLNWERLH